MTEASEMNHDMLALTADIVSAHLSNNAVATGDVADLIKSVHDALTGLGAPKVEEAPRAEPAVSIRASVKHDYIVCLEDGAKLKMLKRYLRTRYNMSPADYRAKWGLPMDYPMVAPAYAEQRRTLAKSLGLGRKKEVSEKAAKPTKGADALKKARARVNKTEKAPEVTTTE